MGGVGRAKMLIFFVSENKIKPRAVASSYYFWVPIKVKNIVLVQYFSVVGRGPAGAGWVIIKGYFLYYNII